ncbi:P-loop containing nucleoside triphosphate hydrolase protein [Vararia minispora EC-137]|uniref:P-loop containing nucleoside triphosphate hydrolase protein n=1 Tax=Vararia minispora EC-137 TaxID=1314806 RepID=A0ACB8QPU5_9AGAM|nr:P-loop containing nucleoside triphosphate hydrolase protein [Vararia minispora EC-137]
MLRRTFSNNLRKSSKPKKANRRDRKYALVVRRLIDERGRHHDTAIDIKSDALCQVLQDINEGVESLELSQNAPQVSPNTLFHSYQGLVRRLDFENARSSPDENLIAAITAAIQVVREDQGSELLEMSKLTAQGLISFSLLWTLFKPNTLAYAYHPLTEQTCVLLVRDTEYMQTREGRFLVVNYDEIRYDGNAFGYARGSIRVKQFPGTCAITDLSIYPLEYHSQSNDTYNQAVELGKLYACLPEHAYYEVSGQAMRDGRSDGKPSKFYTCGRAMFSPSAFRRFQPNSSYNPDVRRAVQKESLTEEQYAICTPIVLGFSFDQKSWGGFALSRARDVIWNETAFAALVLGEKQKSLIHALVREHATGSSGFDDVIQGKGRGLVGMLAGMPGCGKTLTAEAVAETTHRPLYAVSVGELGTTPEDVEHRLLQVLELAQMWDAVLLLDEADVFLQKRSAGDINRNALVSIFLRHLEYYQGIMILTTNMVGQCDHAFESRIHFSVYYPELDRTARKAIWENFFKKQSVPVRDVDLDELANYSINGRQIKNAFSSAHTMARANGSPHLGIEDVRIVLSVLNDWKVAVEKSSALAT